MSRADSAIVELAAGRQVEIRPRGRSMAGRVEDGQRVLLAPCATESLAVDDIVLVRVGGTVFLHLIKAIDGDRYQIGNNRGFINGWVEAAAIYGKAVAVGE